EDPTGLSMGMLGLPPAFAGVDPTYSTAAGCPLRPSPATCYAVRPSRQTGQSMPGLWAIFTVAAAAGQVLRNAQQKELTAALGTVGATHVRFLFGLPFGLLFLLLVLAGTGLPLPHLNGTMLAWSVVAALAQIGATALLLAAM